MPDDQRTNVTHSFIIECLKAAPPIVLTILTLLLVVIYGPTINRMLKAGSIASFEAVGIKISLVQSALGKINDIATTGLTEDQKLTIINRFKQSSRQAEGFRILWVDDNHPFQNAHIRRALNGLAISVDTARSTSEALEWLERDPTFDLIVSDIGRSNDPQASCDGDQLNRYPSAACDMLNKIRVTHNRNKPIIFYSTLEDTYSIPSYVFRVTGSNYELIHSIIDAIDRRNSLAN